MNLRNSDTQNIRYISARALRVATLDSTGDPTYFLPDHLGSTNVLLDGSQNIVRATQYTPFGSISTTAGTKDSDVKFTGQRLDDSTGLYYYNARYYDSLPGRFTTPDPVIQNVYDPQALNRLAYCRNNPIKLTDPTGLDFDTKMMNWWGRTFDTRKVDNFLQRNHVSGETPTVGGSVGVGYASDNTASSEANAESGPSGSFQVASAKMQNDERTDAGGGLGVKEKGDALLGTVLGAGGVATGIGLAFMPEDAPVYVPYLALAVSVQGGVEGYWNARNLVNSFGGAQRRWPSSIADYVAEKYGRGNRTLKGILNAVEMGLVIASPRVIKTYAVAGALGMRWTKGGLPIERAAIYNPAELGKFVDIMTVLSAWSTSIEFIKDDRTKSNN